MLGEMAREADNLFGKLERLAQALVFEIKPGRFRSLIAKIGRRHAPDLAGKRRDDVDRQPHSLPHLPDRTARTIVDHS